MSYLLSQTWHDLLFAHWPVPEAQLRSWIPDEIGIDRFGGEAWIAAVPLRMTDIRFRGTPAVPYLSSTLELNLRTYVTVRGVPGVFFFSLDASSPIAVRIARRFFHLPYFDATMSCIEGDGLIDFQSQRDDGHSRFHARYGPLGPAVLCQPGTLEYFLTERYSFYTTDRVGGILRGDISHQPWLLQRAEAEFLENGLALPWNIELPDTPPLLYYAKHIDILAQGLRKIDGDRRL